MKKSRLKVINYIATILLIGLIGWYISNNWASFQQITLVNEWLILGVLGFLIINIYTIGMVVEIAIEPHGIRISKGEVFGLSSLTRFANQIAPGYLGATIRAVYLKKKYKVSYSEFSSSFLLSNVLQFLISGVVVLAIFTFQNRSLGGPQSISIVFLAMLFFVSLLFIPLSAISGWTNDFARGRNNRVFTRLTSIIEEYAKVRKHPGLLIRTLFWMVLTLLTSTIAFMCLYGMLGDTISFVDALFISAFAGWSIIFSLTPANIGVREGLMAVAAQLIGVSVPLTITVAFLYRIITFLLVAALSAYFAPKLFNKKISNLKSLSFSK